MVDFPTENIGWSAVDETAIFRCITPIATPRDGFDTR